MNHQHDEKQPQMDAVIETELKAMDELYAERSARLLGEMDEETGNTGSTGSSGSSGSSGAHDEEELEEATGEE
jgi:hypothetical protein